ncbi:MAG: helix-turn-helix domain-containing protein, partial [Zavarzinia sp.]|nr:helix-turn-helix domain-containing protein [Zavarzinia sp.]
QRGGETVRLTSGELTLMRLLAERAGEPISREELAEATGQAQERTIDVQVTRLRRKIEDDPRAPHHLQTVRGKGYVLWLS